MKAKAIVLTLLVALATAPGIAQHDHPAMAAQEVQITGNAIPNLMIERSALLNMTPTASDGEYATTMKQLTRNRLAVDDSRLLPALQRWYALDQAAVDRYNEATERILTPNGVDSNQQEALELVFDSEKSAAIKAFLGELGGIDRSARDRFDAYVRRLKGYSSWNTSTKNGSTLPGNLVQASTRRAKLKNADIVYTNTSNGYLYTLDFAISTDNYVYESMGVTGHTATQTWTCIYDQYHQQWQPAGCTCWSAGVPCHQPTVTAEINGNSSSNSGNYSPTMDVNVTAYQRNLINPLPDPKPTASPVGIVFCTAAAANISSFTIGPKFDLSSVSARVQNGTGNNNLCSPNAVLCNNTPFVSPSTVMLGTGACNTYWYGDTVEFCVKPHSQPTWSTSDCEPPALEINSTQTVLPKITCDAQPK